MTCQPGAFSVHTHVCSATKATAGPKSSSARSFTIKPTFEIRLYFRWSSPLMPACTVPETTDSDKSWLLSKASDHRK